MNEVEKDGQRERQVCCGLVPPGFRFHPTDEELVSFYLRKKVAEPATFELDHVIPEVDLNKHEPWDLRDKCNIDAPHPCTEWYFFSHKDKKYPTGTRTNRATNAGFWKATGRDKVVLCSSSRSRQPSTASQQIGMRKTLVFYRGRAPRGMKTDWIMHEYRIHDGDSSNKLSKDSNEDGWVVCRIFRKKSYEEKNSHAWTSSVDHSNSTVSDEEPSAIKTNNRISMSNANAASSHSAMSTPDFFKESLQFNGGEIINQPIRPAAGNNVESVFYCKQEYMGDPLYEELINHTKQEYRGDPLYEELINHTKPSIYQLPSLETYSAPNTTVPGPASMVGAYVCTSATENQAQQWFGMNYIPNPHQTSACRGNFNAEQHEFAGMIPTQYTVQNTLACDEALGNLVGGNVAANGQIVLPESMQGWSFQDNTPKLLGNTSEAWLANIANDQSFLYFNDANINKLQQSIDNYAFSDDVDHYNFTR